MKTASELSDDDLEEVVAGGLFARKVVMTFPFGGLYNLFFSTKNPDRRRR